MKRLFGRKLVKISLLALCITLLPLSAAGCGQATNADAIYEILRNIGAVDGEVKIVTKDGETITITVTKDASTDNASAARTEKPKDATIKKDSYIEASSLLPGLESIEDVFKTLGVWEDAARLREKGLTWARIADELGYDKERMRHHLQEIAEERLKSSTLTHEQVEAKLGYFDELAMKWINKIYADGA